MEDKKARDSKKIWIMAITIIFAIVCVIWIVNRIIISNDAQKAKDDTYEDISNLCKEYGLNDAEIEVGDPEYNSNYGWYEIRLKVSSDKYMSLSAEDAFNFCREFYDYYPQNLKADMNYRRTLLSDGHEFDYKLDHDDGTWIGYVCEDYSTVITGKQRYDEDKYTIVENYFSAAGGNSSNGAGETGGSGLTKQKKLEIMAYINGIMDPLNEDWSLSDEYLEEKANQVWKDAERIYGVSESDIVSIMMDTELTREYYSTKH